MFDGYLLPINLVLNEKKLHLNVLGPLRTARPSLVSSRMALMLSW
jgi:hypothetical protein